MKFTGENTLPAPVDQVWDALLDPAVLVRTIPGCERMESRTGGATRVRDDGHRRRRRDQGHLHAARACSRTWCPTSRSRCGSRAPGRPARSGPTVQVRFAGEGDTTTVTYDADAVVGGMVGGVGQRMLTSVSRRMAGEFFGNVGDVLERRGRRRGVAAVGRRDRDRGRHHAARLHRRPPGPGRLRRLASDFLTGVAVGAGLVLLGVLLGRRR